MTITGIIWWPGTEHHLKAITTPTDTLELLEQPPTPRTTLPPPEKREHPLHTLAHLWNGLIPIRRLHIKPRTYTWYPPDWYKKLPQPKRTTLRAHQLAYPTYGGHETTWVYLTQPISDQVTKDPLGVNQDFADLIYQAHKRHNIPMRIVPGGNRRNFS